MFLQWKKELLRITNLSSTWIICILGLLTLVFSYPDQLLSLYKTCYTKTSYRTHHLNIIASNIQICPLFSVYSKSLYSGQISKPLATYCKQKFPLKGSNLAYFLQVPEMYQGKSIWMQMFLGMARVMWKGIADFPVILLRPISLLPLNP